MPGVYGMVNRMPPAVVGGGDTSLLAGETDGLAIDFTLTSQFDLSTWAQLWNQVRTSSVDVYSSPHSFYTQAGTSPKVVKISSTQLGWSPHNLVSRSQDFTHGDWNTANLSISADTSVAPDGTTTADTATNTSTSDCRARNFVTVVAGVAFTASVYAKKGTTDNYIFVGISDFSAHAFETWFNINTGTIGTASSAGSAVNLSATITNVGSGWYRCTVTGTTPTAASYFKCSVASADNSISATSGATQLWWGAQINRGVAATAYIATTSAAVNGLPISYGEGLLVEPAATNNVRDTENFANATWWIAQQASVTTNTSTAPDGSTTADTLTADGSNNNHDVYTGPFGFGVGAVSCYAKAGTGNFFAITWTGGGGSGRYISAVYDLSNGTVGETSLGGTAGTLVSATIENIGSGWYRCKLTGDSGGVTFSYMAVFVAGAASGNSFDTGGSPIATTSASVLLWGAQVENGGTVVTSYIPTLGSTVTRSADEVKVATANFPSSNVANTMFADFILLEADTVHTSSILHHYKNGGNFTWMVYAESDQTARHYNVDGAGNTFINANGATVTANVRYQWAAASKANDFADSMDGGSVQTDTSGTMPTTTPDFLGIGVTPDGSASNGRAKLLRRIIYVPRRVSDGSLPTWRYNF